MSFLLILTIHHPNWGDIHIGLGIGWKFTIDNQLQPADRLTIIIGCSHFFNNLVLVVQSVKLSDSL